MIRAVIFDMDGVLIDSEPLWNKATILEFKKIGISLTQEMCNETIGVGILEAISHTYRKFPWDTPSQKVMANRVLKTAEDLILKEGKMKEGVLEIISFIQKKNIKIGLASSANNNLIHAVVKKLQIHSHFHIIHSAQFELKPKPDPAVFLTAAKKLGVKPNECLVFEDSPAGILAAKRAGMICVAMIDERSRGTPAIRRADFQLQSFLQFDEKLWEKVKNL